MFSRNELLYFNIFLCVLSSQTCWSKLVSAPSLVLYSPGDPEHTDVIIKRVHDDLTLVCELRGDPSQRNYVWTRPLGERPLTIAPRGPTSSSILQQTDLQLSDSGQYTCSAPPFSVTKYVLVQTKDTYIQNGRIRLLGADLPSPPYPGDREVLLEKLQWGPHIKALSGRLSCAAYAVHKIRQLTDVPTARYKPYGSPLEYFSREVLKTEGAKADEDRADTNVELLNNLITGVNAVVTGSGNVVSGNDAVITGDNNHVTGHDNVVSGNGNYVSGNNGVITGDENDLSGNNDVITGDKNDVSGNNGAVTGIRNVVRGNNVVITGNENFVSANNVIITGNGHIINEDNVVISESSNRVTRHDNIVNGDRNDVSGNNDVVNGNDHVDTKSNQVINEMVSSDHEGDMLDTASAVVTRDNNNI